MFARPGNCEQIQQLEVIKIQRVEQPGGSAFLGVQTQPLVKACLGVTQRLFQAGNTCGIQGVVPAFGDERNLIFQVVHPAVHWRGREHEYFGLYA
jgi:hypothetical protein